MGIRIVTTVNLDPSGLFNASAIYVDSDSTRWNTVGLWIDDQPGLDGTAMLAVIQQAIVDAVNADNESPGKATTADIIR